MLHIGTARGGFDQAFMLVQVIAVILGLVALLAGRSVGVGAGWLAAVAVAVSVGALAYWSLAHPPQTGLDRAGRVLLGVPAVLVNVVIGGIVVLRHWRR